MIQKTIVSIDEDRFTILTLFKLLDTHLMRFTYLDNLGVGPQPPLLGSLARLGGCLTLL